MNTDSNETPTLACDLTAIPAEVREEHVMEQQENRDQQAFMRLDDAVAWAEAAVVGLAMIAMA